MPNALTDNACSYTTLIIFNTKNLRNRSEREAKEKGIKESDGGKSRDKKRGREEQVLCTGKRDEGVV